MNVSQFFFSLLICDSDPCGVKIMNIKFWALMSDTWKSDHSILLVSIKSTTISQLI